MNEPLISVIMPVYNGGEYIQAAIQSLLSQTFKDFELLILNDASTDNSLNVIQSFNDGRIRLFDSKINLGLVSQLNIGLDNAKGKYIARMDQDDISAPDRLKMQYTYLEEHHEIALLGSFAKYLPESYGKVTMPCAHDEIRLELLLKNAFIHSSVMYRKQVLFDHGLRFDDAFRSAEDYHMWVRLSGLAKTANMPEFLLQYRLHAAQISQKDNHTQTKSADDVRFMQIADILGRKLSETEKSIHNQLIFGNTLENAPGSLTEWVAFLRKQNTVKKIYPQVGFEKLLDHLLKRELHRYFLWNQPEKGALRKFIKLNYPFSRYFSIKEKLIIIKRNLIKS